MINTFLPANEPLRALSETAPPVLTSVCKLIHLDCYSTHCPFYTLCANSTHNGKPLFVPCRMCKESSPTAGTCEDSSPTDVTPFLCEESSPTDACGRRFITHSLRSMMFLLLLFFWPQQHSEQQQQQTQHKNTEDQQEHKVRSPSLATCPVPS